MPRRGFRDEPTPRAGGPRRRAVGPGDPLHRDALDALGIERVTVVGHSVGGSVAAMFTAAYEIRGTRAALLTYIRRQYTIDGIRLVLGTYEDIATPVLQVHGTRDASIPIAAARGLTPRLRDARFVAVEGASHDVHIDAPDELVAATEAFELETPWRARKDLRE